MEKAWTWSGSARAWDQKKTHPYMECMTCTRPVPARAMPGASQVPHVHADADARLLIKRH